MKIIFTLLLLLPVLVGAQDRYSGGHPDEGMGGFKNELSKLKEKVYLHLYTKEEINSGISDSLLAREFLEMQVVATLKHGTLQGEAFWAYEERLLNALDKEISWVMIFHAAKTQALDDFMKKIENRNLFGVESSSSKRWGKIYQRIAGLGEKLHKGYKLVLKLESGELSEEKFFKKLEGLGITA